jgi:hypothetical protein
MEKILEKLFDLKKIPTKLIFVLWICSGVILFVSELILVKLNLKDFLTEFGKYIGITFLISTAFLLISLINYIANKIRYKKLKKSIEKDILTELTRLGFHEKVLLREFYINQKDALQLPMDNDTVVGLTNKRILYQVSGTGFTYVHGAYFTYSITEFAKKHLTIELIGLHNNMSEDATKKMLQERPEWAKDKQYFENR